MFDILFGWRKASKCKNLIRHVQCRLKFLKNKKCSIVKQLREDVTQLLKNGHSNSAFARAEQLYKDQSLMDAYDLLNHFCEFITIHLPYIRRHKDCPNDINEAVSSLIFASARCGDLPELQMIRNLFGERYGHKFARAAVELLPGNLVNRQIREKLSIKLVPDEGKLRLMDEISKEYSLQLGQLGFGNRLEPLHQHLYENGDFQWEGHVFKGETRVNCNSTRVAQMQASYVKDSPVNNTSFIFEPSKFTAEPLKTTRMHRSEVKVENCAQVKHFCEPGMILENSSNQSGSCSSNNLYTASSEHKVETTRTGTPSENSFQFHERTIVYLDDVEEFQSNARQDCCGEDQRIFIFNSTFLPLRDNYGVGRASLPNLSHNDSGEHFTDKPESWDTIPCSGDSSKRLKSDGKRLKRRSNSRESHMNHSNMSQSLSMKDIESDLYYGESCNCSPNQKLISHRFCQRSKHRRKMPTQEGRSSSFTCREKLPYPQRLHYAGEAPKHICCDEIRGNHLSNKCKYNQRRSCSSHRFSHDMDFNCCLEHPCYFCTSDGKDDWGSPSWRQRRGAATNLVGFSAHNLKQEEWIEHWDSPLQRPSRRSHENNSTDYNVMASWDDNSDKQCRKVRGETEEVLDCPASCASSHSSCSRGSSPFVKATVRAPYLRVTTMPPERPKGTASDSILRSASCQFQHSNRRTASSNSHVHPKLPDYDDLAAKFMALKKEHQQRKNRCSCP